MKRVYRAQKIFHFSGARSPGATYIDFGTLHDIPRNQRLSAGITDTMSFLSNPNPRSASTGPADPPVSQGASVERKQAHHDRFEQWREQWKQPRNRLRDRLEVLEELLDALNDEGHIA